MESEVITTGITGNTYKALFRRRILQVRPPAVGMAVAYISASGFSLVKEILDEGGVSEVRLVTSIGDCVTHPKALQSAVDNGWNVRIVGGGLAGTFHPKLYVGTTPFRHARYALAGTFHPKLYVGATGFHRTTGAVGLSLAITGSPNLTRNGFLKNGECVFWSTATHDCKSAARAWLDCWNAGVTATAGRLAVYEKFFAQRNRYRKPEDMVAFGIADNLPGESGDRPKKGLVPPKTEYRAISEAMASVAWVGLQSFTGQYSLQVEFPKEAGLVLLRIFKSLSRRNTFDIPCADGKVRTFEYKFHKKNGMFRLNIRNSTPGVAWARTHKKGIACVEYNEKNKSLYFEILPPGRRMADVIGRSRVLGTWGKTPTRLYGWY